MHYSIQRYHNLHKTKVFLLTYANNELFKIFLYDKTNAGCVHTVCLGLTAVFTNRNRCDSRIVALSKKQIKYLSVSKNN